MTFTFLFAEFVCDKSRNSYTGNNVTFSCTIFGINNITLLAIENDLKENFSLEIPPQSTAKAKIEDLYIYVEINLNSLLLTFLNLSCSMQGDYVVRLNNDTKNEQTVSLGVIGRLTCCDVIALLYLNICFRSKRNEIINIVSFYKKNR